MGKHLTPAQALSGVSTKGFNRAQWWLNFAACATLVLTAVLI